METLQNLLTIAAEATVIVGLAGIFAHALYTSHRNFMTEFCPPVAPYQPEAQAEEAGVVTSPVSKPLEVAQAEAPAVVEAVATEQPEAQPEIQAEEVEPAVAISNLTALDPTALRKLCTKYEIAWKHARGKNRHATKSMMIHQLQQRLTA